jgi:coenzyme Q-binding protein COQ10
MRYFDTTLLPYPCEQVFDMVADIERYPEFLPGWTHARILDRNDNRLHAEQQLQTGPAVFRFHSTALLEPCVAIHISSGDGPFRDMHIDWGFSPLTGDQCRVTIEMTLAMQPGLANGALRLLLEAGSSELLPLFGRRARALYSRA